MHVLHMHVVETVDAWMEIIPCPILPLRCQFSLYWIEQNIPDDSRELCLSNDVVVALMLPKGAFASKHSIAFDRSSSFQKLSRLFQQSLTKCKNNMQVVRHNTEAPQAYDAI